MIDSEVRDVGLSEGGCKETRVAKEETEPQPRLWRTWLFQAVHPCTACIECADVPTPKASFTVEPKIKGQGGNGGSVKSHCKKHGHWAGRGNEAINSIYRSNTTCWLMRSTEISLSQLSPQ